MSLGLWSDGTPDIFKNPLPSTISRLEFQFSRRLIIPFYVHLRFELMFQVTVQVVEINSFTPLELLESKIWKLKIPIYFREEI